MPAGTTQGDTCARRIKGQAKPCPGIIDVVANGTDAKGQPRAVLGCTTCWTTLRPASTQLVDRPLFGGGS